MTYSYSYVAPVDLTVVSSITTYADEAGQTALTTAAGSPTRRPPAKQESRRQRWALSPAL